MKNNVIKHAFMVPLDSDGSLEIIGVFPSSVVFKATSYSLRKVSFKTIKFAKNLIVTSSPIVENQPILIFEYTLRDTLRNPQKLLRSVRNKLMGAVYSVERVIDHETDEEDLKDYYWGAWQR